MHSLLYYVHTTKYNIINCNFPQVIVLFHTQRRFHTSLSIRVSDSGHPVTYARQFLANKPGHKIYRCILVCSTQHHTLLHNPTIIQRKTFFAPAYHPCKIYPCMSAHSTRHHTLLYDPTILHTVFFAPYYHLR